MGSSRVGFLYGKRAPGASSNASSASTRVNSPDSPLPAVPGLDRSLLTLGASRFELKVLLPGANPGATRHSKRS